MNMLNDRLDESLFDDPDEVAWIRANVGFGRLTLSQARAALAKAKQVDEADEAAPDLEHVVDELEEIVDDLEFAADPKNRIVTWIAENSARLEARVLERYAIDGLMIRAHVDRGHLMILGKATAPVAGVEAFVTGLCGFPARSRVVVAGDSG